MPLVYDGSQLKDFSCFHLYFFLCFQSAPTASIASDIVYRHVPSATCVSEVLFSVLFIKIPINVNTMHVFMRQC